MAYDWCTDNSTTDIGPIISRVVKLGKPYLGGKRTNGGTRPDSGTNRVLKRDGDMILYGCPATGTVSLNVPSLVRFLYGGTEQIKKKKKKIKNQKTLWLYCKCFVWLLTKNYMYKVNLKIF